MTEKCNVIYLDCFAGISGNMLLGALIDVGMPEELLRSELAKLPISGYEIKVTRVNRGDICALYVDVRVDEHGHHHRNLTDITTIIDQSGLGSAVKENSKQIFTRLAYAEAKVHGVPVDEIHFHEVGAIDSIVDIVGVACAFDYLGVERIYTSRLHVGSGFIKCCHGLIPVPAPATAELLNGIPYYQGAIAKELVTPTGAAILAILGSGFGSMPEGFISRKIGYGAGTWEIDIPNVTRLYLGEIKKV
ncbi:nickel pincer cofactor biosynthesis protein LarC [Sporomusa acidovorans]|uniref:Pyridinium-3,5-bisthiocarboxylic acid mononucleotide nickel insertion protein n=1 Tax=Sporomusa acidovorans (strain ATCC 49682 / DSM 3132 / Mol) TaxID=1123286 RepID=A0ABZ3J671_SPOA4|nr:nickel pincer cofactor biosynthesis protein LarC [Sporomusa acidovorans]OZC18495.1 hypothetical protein SPACI_33610 [Sporomusa acidovorans DSM 3132]SDE36625.1 hypothetical protein SAMN04488499_101231 [Sporomusa acidovorans]